MRPQLTYNQISGKVPLYVHILNITPLCNNMRILDSTTHLLNPWSTTLKMRNDFGVYGEKTQMCLWH